MKPAMPAGLATWMLEHLTFGRDNESLSGDLLEELRGGRSAGWYFRQVSMAIAIGVCEAIREYASPLLFSAGWSALYPLCMAVYWENPACPSGTGSMGSARLAILHHAGPRQRHPSCRHLCLARSRDLSVTATAIKKSE